MVTIAFEECLGKPYRLVRSKFDRTRGAYPILDDLGTVLGVWRNEDNYFEGHRGQKVNVSNKGIITHCRDASDAVILDTHPDYDPQWTCTDSCMLNV